MEANTSYHHYWGKTGEKESRACHLLPYHCLDVAAVGQRLLEQHQPIRRSLCRLTGLGEDELIRWTVFFLALHDIGKFATSFQQLRPDLAPNHQPTKGYSRHHDTLGYDIWKSRLKPRLQEQGVLPHRRRGQIPADYWMLAVTGHHGQPPELTEWLQIDHFTPADEQALLAFADDARQLLLPDALRFPDLTTDRMKAASWWLAGFAVLCDWIGSNADFFPYHPEPQSLDDYWNRALDQAEQAIAHSELIPATPSDRLGLEQLIPNTPNPQATPLQQKVNELTLADGPQLFILEDVTGAGKTEAALLLAHRLMSRGSANGIYFGLPTMATANAMYDRLGDSYRQLYGEASTPSLVLAHSARNLSTRFRQSLIPETQHPESSHHRDDPPPASTHCGQWLADHRKKALLAEIGVGTIDQALLGILPSRHQSLRLLGLLGKVLLVDEVHACDAYMQQLLCRLLTAQAMAGGSAILLSATLPQRQRQALINAFADGLQQPHPEPKQTAYPLLSHYNGEQIREYPLATRPSVRRRVVVECVHEIDAITAILKEVVANGECACWIRNSVADAREAWQQLKADHPEWQIELFHARFALDDRLNIEQQVVARFGPNSDEEARRGRLLIATQVVEQSLDLDFDRLISDLAPIDLLIQRAGRLHRHSRDPQGNRIDGDDRRGQPTLTLHTPEWTETPGSDWFKATFPRVAPIYPDHGQLWLGMKRLHERGGFAMPEDARGLIEGVYGNEAEPPEGLLAVSLGAEGNDKAAASFAIQNALNLPSGYSREDAWNWIDDAKTPTRLGEESTTVWLARWRERRLEPWCDEGDFRWQRSSLSLRSALISESIPNDEITQSAIDACLESLPAKGKWGVLLPLIEQSLGQWQGIVQDAKGDTSALYYNPETGLTTAREQQAMEDKE
ncbi:CRISPR-associated helicase Cas3' [Candidatus Endoriftia persephone]|jgi:CRISPR-associated endonuclease/helicase Cas3|nr:CRISPR-associated helicase Cas3' [Candidatus Endoriftia persephone]USF87089.1 CRISPR-associated helicase Cas3' [Candidatus Endoriftia persephone]